MTLRLGWLSEDWIYADATSEITFEASRERVIKMDVRTEQRTNLFVTDEDGEPHFLCTVDVMESIEFNAKGAFGLYGDAPIYVRTADSTSVALQNDDPEIFTKMHDRRPVAPEIMAMQKLVHQNMERMRATMMRDLAGMKRSTERELARRADALAKAEEDAKAAGKPASDNGQTPAEAVGSGGKAKDAKPDDAGKK